MSNRPADKIKTEIDRIITNIKLTTEEQYQMFKDKYGDNIQQFIKESEDKVSTFQKNIGDKITKTLPKREEMINRISDSLVEAITKFRDKVNSK